jgi:cysteine synthase A
MVQSILDAIGDTPLVELSNIVPKTAGRILVKLEYLSPGFSKKDRIARQIIADVEASGELHPGRPVIALTSGNTGTGLAIVCRARGYPFIAVMSKGNSPERAQMMRAFGAEVILVDQHPHSKVGEVSGDDLALVDEVAQQTALDRGGLCIDQFQHTGNLRAHYLQTGPEIWRQAEGRVDAFCDFVGTGGSFAGCARALKEYSAGIKCFVVEPAGAAALAGERVTSPSHAIQGGGYSMPNLPLIDRTLVDGYLTVTSEVARTVARQLASEEGIFGGFSAGANVAATLDLLAGPLQGSSIVTLASDSGLKYLSTDLWD